MSNSPFTFAYFGGEPLGAPVLEVLMSAGLRPALIVASPDRLVGRKQVLTSPALKLLGDAHGIEVFQPATYKDDLARTKLEQTTWDVFVVVAYNFILPKWLIGLPKHGTVNLHPSLLPKLRGASPIRSAILRDEPDAVGVSVMLLDEKMDHGPLLAQQPLSLNTWPIAGPTLDTLLAAAGGELLQKTLPGWIAGNITSQEQDHTHATYCGRFTTSDSELTIDPLALPSGETARQAWLKISAFAGIGDTFFKHNERRVKINSAVLHDDQLVLLRVTPEGRREMDFSSFLASLP